MNYDQVFLPQIRRNNGFNYQSWSLIGPKTELVIHHTRNAFLEDFGVSLHVLDIDSISCRSKPLIDQRCIREDRLQVLCYVFVKALQHSTEKVFLVRE